MKAGIIGLPSAGKTTIFNVLTRGKAAAGPAAGRKLDPNVGVVKVPDPRLNFLSSKFNPKKTTYATVEFVDVHGLVGAKGQDLALAPVRTVEALVHVVRWFQDESVPHSDGDRKSTRLNSSHSQISYAVFCLKKKNKTRSRYCYYRCSMH